MKRGLDTPVQLLVILPSWVGDAVMATPTLRALRQLYPDARITGLMKAYIRPVVDASPWLDRRIVIRPRRGRSDANQRKKASHPPLSVRLKRRGFDAAVLLPNSFRAALIAYRAAIPRRIGYDRDGRGMMLTDRLAPQKVNGRFQPISAVDYYLKLAEHLGAEAPSRRMELFTRPADDARADEILSRAGVAPDAHPLILLNPGAATKGDRKLWPAERFAAVADRLAEHDGATVLMNGSPKEREILDAVHAAAARPIIDLARLGGDLTLLKSFARRCDLAITNDTGLRHIAAAMGTPVVSLFGPTDPKWTELDFEHERIIQAPDGLMTSIEVDQVCRAADELLSIGPEVRPSGKLWG